MAERYGSGQKARCLLVLGGEAPYGPGSSQFSACSGMLNQVLPFAIFAIAMTLGFVLSYRKEVRDHEGQ